MIELLTSTGDYLRNGLNAHVKTVSDKFDDWDVRYYIDDRMSRNAKSKPEKRAREAGSPWLILEADIDRTESLQSGEKVGEDLVNVYKERYSINCTLSLICLVGEINAAKPEMRWNLINEIRNLCRVGNDFSGYAFETLTISGKQDLTGRIIDFEEPWEHQFEIPLNIQGVSEIGRVNNGEQKFDKLSGTVKEL
ncbi:hypothetical protein KAR91_73790 [Candidatus Pacearchaeota archaeon]|nr:hypothetical protein [Candidatus Pacearchaeota archaeon]